MARSDDARTQQTTRWYVNAYLYADDPNLLPLGENVLDGLRFGQRWVMRYGESPWQVVYASVTIVVFGILFPLLCGVSVERAAPTDSFFSPIVFPWSVPEPVSILLTSFYFSAVTFTTLGYGGMQPSSPATQFSPPSNHWSERC